MVFQENTPTTPRIWAIFQENTPTTPRIWVGFQESTPTTPRIWVVFQESTPTTPRIWVVLGIGKKPIASVFKSGCDDFLLHCIWERERRKRGDRYLLQAVDIVLRHLGTAFAIHTRRNDATGIACSFATREKPPQAHVLQGFAVA